MKIQFICLVVCVVASFALPDRNRSVNNELRQQDEQQQEFVTNQETAVVNVEPTDIQDENIDENTVSSNQTAAERFNKWTRRVHDRQNWLKNREERRGRNRTELNNEERSHPFMDNSIGQDQQTLFPYKDNIGTEEAAVVYDEPIDSQRENVDERTVSSNQTAAERANNWITRRHIRRNWLRNGEGSRGRNSTELNNGERRHPIMHDPIGQGPHSFLPNNGNSGTQENHPRHHHRRHHRRHHHHHHHHCNRTTTTASPLTTTTTSTTPTPLSDVEEIAMYRQLTPN